MNNTKSLIQGILEITVFLLLIFLSLIVSVVYQEFEKIVECEKTYHVCELVAIPR
jgi:hypothetical protein